MDDRHSLEKYHLHELQIENALKAVPKFNDTNLMYNTWGKRLLGIKDMFSFLEKESYEKYQMMVERMEESCAESVKDLVEMDEKPFESAIDRLDRQFKQRE